MKSNGYPPAMFNSSNKGLYGGKELSLLLEVVDKILSEKEQNKLKRIKKVKTKCQ